MADKTNPWVNVEPPKRKGRGGIVFPPEMLQALASALSANSGWVNDGETYETKGKASGRAARIKRALVEAKHVGSLKDVRSRVWGDDKSGYSFALASKPSKKGNGKTNAAKAGAKA